MTRSPAYGGTDLIEREPLRLAVMPQPAAERQKSPWELDATSRSVMTFTIAKESLIFRGTSALKTARSCGNGYS